MPPLPKIRVSEAKPFTYTGLDYFGPSMMKQDVGQVKKTWCCLFTCMVVRAVHLELVTADQFLQCLRRFISRRGTPIQIFLDNAPQFKLVKSVLDKTWSSGLLDDNVHSYITNQKFNLNFYQSWLPGWEDFMNAWLARLSHV